jgi:hypothetical protein
MNQQPPAAATQQKVRGRPFVKGQSGNPAGARARGKRFSELYASLAADLTDDPKTLTSIQNALVAQAARMLMRAERAKNPVDTVRLTNAAVRLLGSLRNGRRKPPPAALSLEEHLARTAEGPA